MNEDYMDESTARRQAEADYKFEQREKILFAIEEIEALTKQLCVRCRNAPPYNGKEHKGKDSWGRLSVGFCPAAPLHAALDRLRKEAGLLP